MEKFSKRYKALFGGSNGCYESHNGREIEP